MSGLTVTVRRRIRAPIERVFAAWTRPEQLQVWWGPADTVCIGAEIDARVGGHYAIGNQIPDGQVVWIRGTFDRVEAPHLLVYSWTLGGSDRPELVTVRFEDHDGETEVIVLHERIPDVPARDGHERVWIGCLEGLVLFVGE